MNILSNFLARFPSTDTAARENRSYSAVPAPRPSARFSLEREPQQSDEELRKLNDYARGLQNQIMTLTRKLTAREEEVSVLKDKLRGQGTEIPLTFEKMLEKLQANPRFQEWLDEVLGDNRELDALRNLSAEMQRLRSCLDQDRSLTIQEQKSIMQLLEETQKENAKLKEQNRKLKNKLTTQNTGEAVNLPEIPKVIPENDHQMADLKNKFETLSITEPSHSIKAKTKEQLSEENDRLAVEIRNFAAKSREWEQTAQEFKSIIAQKEALLQQASEREKTYFNNSKKYSNEVQLLTRRIRELELQLTELNNKLENLEQEKSDLKERNDRLFQDFMKINQKAALAEKLEAELADLMDERDSLKFKLSKYIQGKDISEPTQKKLESLEKLAWDLETILNSETSMLATERLMREREEDEIEHLRRENHSAKEEMESLAKRNKELERDVLKNQILFQFLQTQDLDLQAKFHVFCRKTLENQD